MKKIALLALLCCYFGSQAQFGGILKGKKKEEAKPTIPPEITQGITSPTHQKYMNKIVFTSDEKALPKQKEVEANFKNEFNFGDLIYFKVYMDNSILNYLYPIVKGQTQYTIESNSSIIFKFTLDGIILDSLEQNAISRSQFEKVEKETWTTFIGALKPESGVYIGSKAFKEILMKYESKFTVGKHTLKVEVLPIYYGLNRENIEGSVVASGEITLNVAGSIVDPNDTKACMPASNMKDIELEKKIAKEFTKLIGGTAEVVKIVSENWTIIKNKYSGFIINRTIDVSIGYKDSQKGICYKRSFLVSQQHDGAKFVGEISIETDMQNPPKEISCKCLQTPSTPKETETKKEPAKKTTTQPKKGK